MKFNFQIRNQLAVHETPSCERLSLEGVPQIINIKEAEQRNWNIVRVY